MRYFFEDCALDTERRELRRGLDVVPTTPQVLDLLEHLIRSRDRVVSKDDLVNAIWNGRIVSDAALTTRLNAVRRAIGDSGQQHVLSRHFHARAFVSWAPCTMRIGNQEARQQLRSRWPLQTLLANGDPQAGWRTSGAV